MTKKFSYVNRYFWKVMVDIWAIVAMIIFTLEFLFPESFRSGVSYVNIIYPSILTIYTGSKEINRWSDKNFKSLFSGEGYILLWSALFIIFVLFSFLSQGQYHVSLEMSTTYVAVMSIFAISLQSKNFRSKK